MKEGSVPFAALLVTAAVLVILSMIFSAAESAFLSVNKLRIRLLRNKKDKRAERVWKLLGSKDKLINTLLIGNNIVNIALSSIFAFIAIELFGPAGVGIATGAVTVLLLIFGEISPKTVATHHPETVAFFFSRLIEILEAVLSPLVFVFTAVSRLILKAAGSDVQKKKVSYTEEEIQTFLDVGHEQGVLQANEKNMMTRVFTFTDLEAKDIMIPRKQIKAVSVDEPYANIIETAQRLRLSRFPVLKNDIDDIVGILYIKDMLPYKRCSEKFSVRSVMRPPLFVLETKKMSGIQQMMRESRQSMAIVIDEYSGTYGVLTREDIVREIFGPVTDGEKLCAHKAEIRIENSDDFEADGLARLIDLNERLGISLSSGHCETLGGFICEALGIIPSKGNCVSAEGYDFIVSEMDENRISKVRVLRQRQEKTEGES